MEKSTATICFFFRALAFHNGCHPKNLEWDAQHYCERYREFFPEKKKFCGVKLKELIDLEHLYEVNIFVYSLEPTKPDGKEGEEDIEEKEEDFAPEIAAQLVHRSLCHYPSTLYLNLYQNHFSYIKDLKKYAKSYSCSRCGTSWKHVGKLNRHERTCEAKVTYQFPGGAYKTPPTIFQLLNDEGLTIPEHLKFFPYRATFDFECMFTPETDLNDTEKLTWNAKHVPLSVSVCSNVPDYDQPKCFVSDGDSKQLVKEMVEYLVKISEQSYDLLRKEFNFLFEAIDQKLQDLQKKSESCEPSRDNKLEDSTQDDEGEDLMDTDDEKEEIESETEEDRAFIDDDVEEQGASFYRALDREHEDQSENDHECEYHRPEDNSPEPKEKKVHPLKKLRDSFQQYLQELPVLGFNSGKYDLNAVKEFLFSVLVQNEGAQFTIKRNHNFMCLNTPHLRFLEKEINEKRNKPMAELREETTSNSKYIRDQGYNLVEMWECQWRRMKTTNSAVQYFMNRKFHRPLDHHQTLDQNQIIKAIRDESLFGVVECDITAPDHLKPKFSEMCPIFKNTQISKEDIGEYI